MAAIGMKRKAAGLSRKPLYVVPNHMLEQFAREFSSSTRTPNCSWPPRRTWPASAGRCLTAKIASSEWDGIIITHSSFERIGMSREYQARFLREQIAEYDELLVGERQERHRAPNRNIIKTIEKQKASREERLKDLLAEDKKDDGLGLR